MKLYNERLGKIIEGTPMMARLLYSKGWVEVIGEPVPQEIENEVIEVTVDEDEVTTSPIESDKPDPYGLLINYPEQEETPKADPVKKVKAKYKNKK